MYTSPPSIPRLTLGQLSRAFLGRSTAAGLKYGTGAGTGYGCLVGTVMAPGIGTIYGVVVGLVVGFGAGLAIGLAMGLVLCIISAIWFNPIRDARVCRTVLGSVSVIITFGSALLMGWLVFPGMFEFTTSEPWMLLVFGLGPALVGSYFSWKTSQQIAQWYAAERNYEPHASGEVPPLEIRN